MTDHLDVRRLRRCAAGTCWDLGNSVLYDMCRKYPRHENEDQILAKVWLIGRSYSAAIERRPNSQDFIGEDFYSQVVGPKMRRAKIDQWLEPLNALRHVTEENSSSILSAHKRMTDLFYEISGVEKRSLASKYLHFHYPNLFYLYDSRASQAIKRYIPRIDWQMTPKNGDKEYTSHFFRCLQLVGRINDEYDIRLNPRQLDDYLLRFSKRDE